MPVCAVWYFGAYDPKGGAVEHNLCLFHQKTTHHRPEIIGGIQEGDCADSINAVFSEQAPKIKTREIESLLSAETLICGNIASCKTHLSQRISATPA